MLFRHEKKIEWQVDLGDLLEEEKNHLSSFLQSNLKVNVSPNRNMLTVDSEKLSLRELQRVVTKFVYRRNLNGTHWVSVEDGVVKINRFKHSTQKKQKSKKTAPHQTITQSWGF